MNATEILDLLNAKLKAMNSKNLITKEQLDTLALDVTRILDKVITNKINDIKNYEEIALTSSNREKIRLLLLGYPINLNADIKSTELNLQIADEDIKKAYELLNKGFDKNKETMIYSLIARYNENFLDMNNGIQESYINYLNELEYGENQLTILNVNAGDNLTSDNIAQLIKETYDKLSNYHKYIIVFEDTDEYKINWETISEVGIFMENFKKEYNFSVFQNKNKANRINELKEFLSENNMINSDEECLEAADNFYEFMSYGFQFMDLFITDNGSKKILIMQKVELDETPKPCPSCFETLVRGNSYPSPLYKSFECQNPNCPARSKSGRGKRFDLYGVKRAFMLERHSQEDIIKENTFNSFRRDIIKDANSFLESLISLYSWADDVVLIINANQNIGEHYWGRALKYQNLSSNFEEKDLIKELPIYQLFSLISKKITETNISTELNIKKIGESTLINGDSSIILPNINELIGNVKISGAITSPPYFNAREYSQWDNLLCYLIDMMINANSVYKSLGDKATYIYNIGDIVGQDNMYINSYMSNRRQMLGFYSILIFKMVGFHLETNIIWDKGEVQSKRNSTPNHFPNYLNPVNAYEHNLVFKKEKTTPVSTVVKKIDTVRKINSKGENTLGHTAPFPIEIAELIIPYINDNQDYILDPFLGSGTTVIAAHEHLYKAIGIELDPTFYELSIKRIDENTNNLFSAFFNN